MCICRISFLGSEKLSWLRAFHQLPWRDEDRSKAVRENVALRFYHKLKPQTLRLSHGLFHNCRHVLQSFPFHSFSSWSNLICLRSWCIKGRRSREVSGVAAWVRRHVNWKLRHCRISGPPLFVRSQSHGSSWDLLSDAGSISLFSVLVYLLVKLVVSATICYKARIMRDLLMLMSGSVCWWCIASRRWLSLFGLHCRSARALGSTELSPFRGQFSLDSVLCYGRLWLTEWWCVMHVIRSLINMRGSSSYLVALVAESSEHIRALYIILY